MEGEPRNRVVQIAVRVSAQRWHLLASAANLAEQIRAQIQSLQIHFENKIIPITASVGVSALTPTESDDPEFLISSSDSALYEAKNRGRNQVRVYNNRKVQAHIGTPN